MQGLLCLIFVLLATALAFVLGKDLLGDGSLLETVFGLFKAPKVAIALTLSILVAAVIAAFAFAWQARRRRRPIASLVRWLDQRAPSSQDFASNIEDFAAQIPAMHAPLAHAWEEFAETLIRPDPTRVADGKVVRNTVRPSSYFNLHAAVESGFPLPFWQALPNYFVGFGLLCTFLGLVSGLHFAAAGVAGADAVQARESLKDLLNAATFKFLTSIAGVLASLGLSVFVRLQTQSLQRALDNFCSALERRLIFVTPEWLGFEQLREQQKLTAAMERFNTDFAVQLAEALEQRMTKALTNPEGKNVFVAAIENLGETFKGNAGDMGKDISEAVLGGLSSPLTSLTEAMTQLTNASGNAANLVNEFSNTYSQKITQATELFERGITTAAEKIKSAAESASESFRLGASAAGDAFGKGGDVASTKIANAGQQMLEALAPLVSNIGSLQATLTLLQESFKQYETGVSAMKIGMDHSTLALGTVSREFQATATTLGGAAKPVRDAAVALITSANKSVEVSSALKSVLENVRTLSDTITATQTKLGTAWEQYRDRFERTDEKLAATFGTLQDGIERTEKQVMDFVKEIDQHFATAVMALGGSVQELAEVVEELGNGGKR